MPGLNQQPNRDQPEFNLVPGYNAVVYKRGTKCFAENREGQQLRQGTSGEDRLMIQSALDEGGRVLIKKPPASSPYTLDSTSLVIKSNSWLEGEGWNVDLTMTDGIILKNENFGTLWTDTNIWVSNIAMHCTNPTTANSGNLVLDGVQSVRYFRVKSTDSPSECLKVRNCVDAVIEECRVERSAADSGGSGNKAGIMSSASADFESGNGCDMIGNFALDTGGEGLGCYYVQRVNMIGNTTKVTADTYRGGLLMEGDSSDDTNYLEYVNCVGNNVLSNYYCISLQSVRNFSVAHNNCTHYSPTTTGGNGIQLQGFQQNGDISDNSLTNIGEHGISMTAVNWNVNVHNNTIKNVSAKTSNTYDGIYCAPSGGSLRNCIIEHNSIIDQRDLESSTNRMRYGVQWDTGTSQLIINTTLNHNNIYGAVTAPFVLTLSTGGSTLLSQIRDNRGYLPGLITNPFNNTNDKIGMHNFQGSTYAAVPVAQRSYTAVLTDLLVTSTGGTGVSIDLKDENANTYATGLTTLTSVYLPINHIINFGNFSVDPTVTVVGI